MLTGAHASKWRKVASRQAKLMFVTNLRPFPGQRLLATSLWRSTACRLNDTYERIHTGLLSTTVVGIYDMEWICKIGCLPYLMPEAARALGPASSIGYKQANQGPRDLALWRSTFWLCLLRTTSKFQSLQTRHLPPTGDRLYALNAFYAGLRTIFGAAKSHTSPQQKYLPVTQMLWSVRPQAPRQAVPQWSNGTQTSNSVSTSWPTCVTRFQDIVHSRLA